MSKSLKKLIDINRLREFKNKLVGAGSAYVQTAAVDQTVAGTKTFSKPIVGSVTGSSGSCTGNAATATKATQDAAGNTITTTYATKAENNTKANDSDVVHKSGNETIAGTKTFSSQIKGNISGSSTSCTGNSASATELATARTISLTGAVTGSTSFNGSANASINTALSNIDASKITSGTIDLARIPKAAIPELKIVANDTARFALTTSDIQNGDTVQVTSTGKMYYVKDQTKLSSEAGYAVYTAGAASSVPWSGVTGKPSSYTPAAHTQAASTITGLATVATSGSYTDLANKPAIPTVNNATLTIQKNGTTVKTFTANASANVTANITVPTKVSELTNDSGFLTSHQSLSNYVTLNGAQTISGAKTFTGNIIGINKERSTEDANSLYSTTAGSKLTYYTTSNGGTTLTNVPAAVNTTLESRTIRSLSDSDWIVEQICHNSNGLYYRKGSNGTWGAWKTFAFTDSNISGNAATATKATQDSAGQRINTTYIKGLAVSGRTITYTKGDGSTGTITTQDTNTWTAFKGATSSANGTAGYVPAPTKGNQAKFFKADGTWATPTNTTYSNMKGATANTAGTAGLVPAPAAGTQAKYLRGDGTWQTPPNTTYASMSASEATTGTATAARTISAKVLHDKINSNLSAYATKTELNNGLATKANDKAVVHKSGDETIAGIKTFNANVHANGFHSTTANGFMAQCGGYTLVIRNDGSDTYFLMSDKDGVPGTWSDARPLVIHNSTGVCNINGNASTATNATYANWLRTSSHSDHLFHTEWDNAGYFWTYVTAPDGGYRAVRVARSDSSGYADSAGNGVDSQGANWIRFKNGVQICWGYATTGFAFPKPFTAAPAVSLIHQTFANRKILINVGAMDSRNCYFNAYDVEGGIYIDASVSYTAFGYWE